MGFPFREASRVFAIDSWEQFVQESLRVLHKTIETLIEETLVYSKIS